VGDESSISEGHGKVVERTSLALSSFSDDVESNYKDVLKLSKSETRDLITRLSGNQGNTNTNKRTVTTRITDVLLTLPNTIETNIPANKTNQSIAKRTLYNVSYTLSTIPVNEQMIKIGGGTFGSIFVGQTTGNIYKRVSLEGDNNSDDAVTEEFARETCVEVFIQTVLQNDSMYGGNIARILGVFRDLKNRTRTAAGDQTDFTFFYVMEPAGIQIYDYPASSTYAMLQQREYKLLENLGNILAHFDKLYGFRHRDLHGGNVLIQGADKIKLIDFGKSCIRVDGITYAVRGRTCEATDLLILLAAIIQYSTEWNRAPELRRIMRLFLTHNPGGMRTDIYGQMLTHPEGTAFYAAYYDYISARLIPWGTPANYAFIDDKVNGITHLQPENFAAIMKKLRLPTTASGSVTSFDRSFFQKMYNAGAKAAKCVGNACKRLTPTQRGLAAAGTAAAAAAVGVGVYMALRPKTEKLDGGRRRSHRRKHRNNRKTRHRNKRRV